MKQINQQVFPYSRNRNIRASNAIVVFFLPILLGYKSRVAKHTLWLLNIS